MVSPLRQHVIADLGLLSEDPQRSPEGAVVRCDGARGWPSTLPW
ncbi:hypothetical protein [Streptomyces albus]|nr:hypothetical protein [Streptomyces albus]